MLVKVIDHKGKAWYLNPMYVKSLEPKGEAQTAVTISGWSMKMKVDMTPDAVAELLNTGMPMGLEPILADLQAQQQQQAASAVM
ncbi:MAG: hypothetical protein ACI89L_001549 [Phycisphaerales bacterium]|jgi:hypothetical protein